MTKMTEEDFDKLVASTTPEKCDHKDIVKLYYLGILKQERDMGSLF